MTPSNQPTHQPTHQPTQRLYYSDAYSTSFRANLVTITTHDTKTHGAQPALLLDATYFYPTSGGQPHDRGTLAGLPVIDVVAVDDLVYHLVAMADGQVPELGPGQGEVQGEIDWPRRYDHMQQHSGQHLLSQLFYREFGAETVSVHFGEESATLDLDSATITPAQIAQAERMANNLVYAALPIRAYFVSDAELPSVPLRRPPKVTGQIRIVEIDGYDYSACGGTHVHTTAEIGPIKLLRQERRRGQTRLTFLCGKRALTDYIHKHDLLTQAAAVYSTVITRVPELLSRGREQVKTLQRQVDALTAQLLGYEVATLLQAATQVGAWRVVMQTWADRTPDAVKTTANLLQAEPQTIALLATTQSDKTTAIFARSHEFTGEPPHMGNLLRDALKAFGGGGGGRPDYAQGGGVPPEQVAALLAFAVGQLSQGIG